MDLKGDGSELARNQLPDLRCWGRSKALGRRWWKSDRDVTRASICWLLRWRRTRKGGEANSAVRVGIASVHQTTAGSISNRQIPPYITQLEKANHACFTYIQELHHLVLIGIIRKKLINY